MCKSLDACVTHLLLVAAIGVVVVVGVGLGHMNSTRSHLGLDGNRLSQVVILVVEHERAGIFLQLLV